MSRPKVSAEIRARVAINARSRCGYCLTPEWIVGTAMELDHLVPFSLGGLSDEVNFWLACADCNLARSNQTDAIDPKTKKFAPLFNPRHQLWSKHFRWIEGGLLIDGLTATGRSTVAALDLNRERLVHARSWWISAGWHPPGD